MSSRGVFEDACASAWWLSSRKILELRLEAMRGDGGERVWVDEGGRESMSRVEGGRV